MNMLYQLILALLLFGGLDRSSVHNETPQSLAEKLQAEFLASPAVSLSFNLKNQGRIRILADLQEGRLRMESPKLLIISDGKTVWNYDKTADRVTIDNVSTGSQFRSPASLFRFAENYTAALDHSTGNGHYTLVLTPLSALRSITHSAGELQSIRLNVTVHGTHVTILGASAISSGGSTEAEHLELKMLSTIHPSDFIFAPKVSTKVVDLRE